MGIPLITKEGFVGPRMIIDDYFVAGETLHSGDVVVVREDTSHPHPHLPRVYRVALGLDPKRIIGVVHTPAAMEVGEPVADAGDYVPVVICGLAKVLTSSSLKIGEMVSPSGSIDFLAQDLTKTAASVVGTEAPGSEPVIGRCLEEIEIPRHSVEILVDISGTLLHSTPANAED